MGTRWRSLLQSKKNFHFDPFEPLADGSVPVTGETRNKCLMHQDPDLEQFFTSLTHEVIGCLDAASIRTEMIIPYIMKSWCTMLDHSDDMRPHTHACSDLSFVYYVDPPPDSYLRFVNPNSNPNSYFEGVYEKRIGSRSLVRDPNFINSQHYTLAVKPGDLLVFPSNIPHTVPSGGGKGVYLRSIAGDIKLVLKPQYTHLDTGLIHYSHWARFDTTSVTDDEVAHSSNTDP